MTGDLFGGPDVPLSDQIREVRRELAMRERVCPRHVANGLLTRAKAEQQTAALRAVLATPLTMLQ